MEKKTKLLLNEIQVRFPLVTRPYLELGKRCELTETEVIEKLAELKSKGLLRQISAIFNPKAFGYQTSLVAASVPEKMIGEAAQIINSYPGVSHNYLREHHYNLWFTIAVPPEEDLAAFVRDLMQKAEVQEYLLLPVKRVFRIALILDLLEEDSTAGGKVPVAFESFSSVTEETKALVRLTQEDLPLCPRPFQKWAQTLSFTTEDDLLAWIRTGLEKGFIRRFAGLVRHLKAGFKGNVMVAWEVSAERLEEIGQKLASERGVTHCYERFSYPQWPYNLYTMLHAPTLQTALEKIKHLARKYSILSYLPLITRQELKKVRLKLFW